MAGRTMGMKYDSKKQFVLNMIIITNCFKTFNLCRISESVSEEPQKLPTHRETC